MSADNLQLGVGDRFGPYRIEGLLGAGGMGEVYAAHHETLDERYALKLISSEVLADSSSAQRFATEARESFRLKHPRIVRVDNYDAVEGRHYLRMELMPGVAVEGRDGPAVSLEDLLEARGGRLSEQEALPILRDVLEGLAYAHEQGVIHRDLKPANILLHEEGGAIRAKLADFGLVKAVGEEFIQSRIRLSISKSRVVVRETPGNRPAASGGTAGGAPQSGTLDSRELSYIGTYDYMAPEQRDGLEATRQSDLYSIGLIAYRMLTGKKVIGMRTASSMVEGLSAVWDDWIATATDPEPAERFGAAGAMLESLPGSSPSPRAVRRGSAARGGSSRVAASGRGGQRSPVAAVLVTFLVLAVLGAGGWYGYGAYQDHQAEQQRLAAEAEAADEAARRAAEAEQALAAERARAEQLYTEGVAMVAREDYSEAVDRFTDLTRNAHVADRALSALDDARRRLAHAEATGIALSLENESLRNPSGLKVLLNGADIQPPRDVAQAFRLRQLKPGRHALSLVHPDYEPWSKAVTVKDGETAEVEATLVPKPGRLTVNVSQDGNVPSGAMPEWALYVDGSALRPEAHGADRDAQRYQLPAERKLRLEIRAERYKTASRTLTLAANDSETWEVSLEKFPGVIALRVSNRLANPGALKLTLDGEPRTSLTQDGLEAGVHALSLAHPDYELWSRTVTVKDGETTRVEATLMPKPGRLSVSVSPSVSGASLWVNGSAEGAWRPGQALSLPAEQELRLELRADGYKTATRTLTLAANGSDSWQVSLETLRAIFFTEDFSSYNVNRLPPKWTIVFSGQGETAQGIRQDDSGKYLRIAGNRGWSGVLRRDFESQMPDRVEVSLRIRPSHPRNIFGVGNGQVAFVVSLRDIGASTGRWNDVKAIIDFRNRQAQFSVDGQTSTTSVTFGSQDPKAPWARWGNRPAIAFDSSNQTRQEMHVKNIIIRQY